MRKVAVKLVLVASFVGLSFGNALALLDVDVAAGVWQQSLDGNICYKGDTLDAKNGLKLDQQLNPYVSARVNLPILPGLYFMYTPAGFSGSGTLSHNFTFGDTQFQANQWFDSKLVLNHYDVAFFYGIPLLNTATMGIMDAELGLNARFYDLETEITQGNLKRGIRTIIPVPMLYARLKIAPPVIDIIALETEGRGIVAGSNHVVSGVARLKVLVPAFPLLKLSLGYRYDSIKVDASDLAGVSVSTDMKASGPFAEVALEF
ncbi:MAG: TIGR04219 family outer membrane beta-barrel protein [Deltaproteobacteria bacterium]|nr:TIGR04219 family outer membrane beta-barrel protein [Deltaproteobacteria bacterium]